MVMQRPHRVLTPEEFRALPPPTEEEIQRRQQAMESFLKAADMVSEEILAARHGVPFSEAEFQAFLDEVRGDDPDG